MPLFIPGDQFTPSLVDLTVGLSQILFPVVVLLGINGLLVGIANAYHHFTIPALAPLVWNVVIIGALVALHPLFEGQNQIYAYAIGVLLGTIVQLLMVVPVLGRIDFRLKFHLNWRDPGVKRVFILMLPVTIGLGVINIALLINSMVGALISDSAPRAIDAAFRIYMLPQGMFSVALATVLFPSLSRLVARRDRIVTCRSVQVDPGTTTSAPVTVMGLLSNCGGEAVSRCSQSRISLHSASGQVAFKWWPRTRFRVGKAHSSIDDPELAWRPDPGPGDAGSPKRRIALPGTAPAKDRSPSA